MNIAKSTREFVNGLQNIERDIITKLRESGIQITANNILWHRGKEIVPPPNVIELEIKAQGKSTNAVLSREQVADSWERISRPDVSALIRGLIADLIK